MKQLLAKNMASYQHNFRKWTLTDFNCYWGISVHIETSRISTLTFYGSTHANNQLYGTVSDGGETRM